MIIVNTFGADRLRTRLTKIVDQFCLMLRTRYTFDGALQERLSVFRQEEAYNLLISSTICGCFLDDVYATIRTQSDLLFCHKLFSLCGVHTLHFLFVALLGNIYEFNKAWPTECAAALMENLWWSIIERFLTFLFTFMVYRLELFLTFNCVEWVTTVVTK